MNNTVLNNYGDTILKDYTHNEFGNPHSQYVVNQKSIAISPYSVNGKFYRLLSVEMEDLNKMDILAKEFQSLKENVTMDELEKKNKLNEDLYKTASYNSKFEIIFDVYESSYIDCNEIDDKWELFLKITHSQRFLPQSIKVKLAGKARKAILTARESIREEEYRYEKNYSDGRIEYKTKTISIPIIIYELFIAIGRNEEEINFVQKFSNINVKKYKIYNKENCINYIPQTENEIKFMEKQIRSFDEDNSLYSKNEQADILDIFNNSDRDILNKFISRNEFDQIELPCIPNYFRVFTQLFEINMNFEEVYYSAYSGVWEVIIDDAYGAAEFREEDRLEYIDLHETGYIKFMVNASNARGADNKSKYVCELQVLESKNTNGKALYVNEDINLGKFEVWLKASYPQRITLRPCMSNGINGEYNNFKLTETVQYVALIPDSAKLVPWDIGKYIYPKR